MYVTKHATKRMVKRIGINKSACKRLAAKAFVNGYTLDEVDRTVRLWIAANTSYDCSFHSRVYGDVMYIFTADAVLITVLKLPHSITKSHNYNRKYNACSVSTQGAGQWMISN